MNETGWDRETSPYHKGEQELHDRLGRKELQTQIARNIHRPYMVDQHREFFAQLPMLIAGSVDEDGWPWASALFGRPGFLTTPTDRHITIAGGHIDGDPFWKNANASAPVGFVGIELQTRRRNRLNGVVSEAGNTVGVDVVQSYGNCPQYIHTRGIGLTRDPDEAFNPVKETFTDLPTNIVKLITGADTFFVASYNDQDDKYDTGGVDVNHRGGQPGFIKVDGNTLTIPDYIGNFAFNTFGNFLLYPKAGLLFIDFTTGDLVQMTGKVELLWDMNDEIKTVKGAQRAWRFHLDHSHVLKAASPLTWVTGTPSPRTLVTGTWAEAEQA